MENANKTFEEWLNKCPIDIINVDIEPSHQTTMTMGSIIPKIMRAGHDIRIQLKTYNWKE